METYSKKSSLLIVYRLRLDYNECCTEYENENRAMRNLESMKLFVLG